MSAATSPPTRVLSVREPWATLIVRGHKSIENRSWKPPASLRLSCRIAIHASSRRPSPDYWMDFARQFSPLIGEKSMKDLPQHIRPGRIVGSVLVTGYIDGDDSDLSPHESAWYEGEIGWRLADAKIYRNPIEAGGKLNLWVPDARLARHIAEEELSAIDCPLIPLVGSSRRAIDPDENLPPDARISYWDAEGKTDYTEMEMQILVKRGQMTPATADRIRASGVKTSEELLAIYDKLDAEEDPD